MYNLEDINMLVKNPEKIYAHRKYIGGIVDYETLEEHSKRVLKYFSIIDKENNIKEKVINIISNLFEKSNIEKTDKNINFVFDMFINAIYLHDIGKSSPGFQYSAMENKYFEKNNCDRKHSMLSAAIFAYIYIQKVNNRKMLKFILLFSYIISRHHTDLEDVDLQGFCQDIVNIAEYKKDTLSNYIGKKENLNIIKIMYQSFKKCKTTYIYILGKLLFSLIVTCDFAATYEYMNDKEAEVICKFDKQDLIDKYNNRIFIENIRARKADKEINKLRTDIFLESEKNLISNIGKNIFYLEAPTGSGKTNTSINLALKVLENNDINKVFYIFPFNTLAEQTSQVMEFWENRKDFMVINSSTPILENEHNEKDGENREYEKVYFNYQLANYPVVITSHVRFFETLFGIGRENGIWLYKLCNSVVILDEIQSYKNSLWANFINILYDYSKMLNIKIIIMSATLPKLTNLINNDVEACDLVNGEKYIQNKVFKNRVKLDFSMVNSKLTLDGIANRVIDVFNSDRSKNILIEFIFKKTAREFFEILKDKMNEEVVIVEISGDDNKFERKKIIKLIKERKVNIVVATQVIEAGVDIDMDIGFKDISVIDSEEQFIGRINRSCGNEGCAYFFNYDNEKVVYRDDVRTDYSIKAEKEQKILASKGFIEYFDEILKSLYMVACGGDFNKNSSSFEEETGKLMFKTIKKRMKLIDSDNYQIVLNYNYTYDDNIYVGAEIWEEYKKLLKNENGMDYGELKTKLSIVREKLDMFTFNISGNYRDREVKNYTERIGNIFYFENGEEYISEDGKFEREKFEQSMGGMFI